MLWTIVRLLAVLLAFGSNAASASTLVINSNASDPIPRLAWERVVADFRREHLDIDVQVNVFDHEGYKQSIRNWLSSSPPDVVFWFAGTRMRQFVDLGLLTDVSDLFTSATRAELAKPAIDLVSFQGKQYGVPYSHYHVGFFFRRDLLEQAGIDTFPANWTDFVDACAKLRSAGIDPVAIGTKDLWPTGAWFDYINLRMNGYRFHMDLMDGKVSYEDDRVRRVMLKWRELLDRRSFVEHHASSTWQESQALMYQGKAAMMLIGNYIAAGFPPEIRDKMEFAAFPRVDGSVSRYEDAPMNSLHIPARARNQENAKKFLAFLLRADVQGRLNKATLTVPTNLAAPLAEDRFIAAGRAHLGQAEGLTQYFDRDTDEELATIAMKGFQEFMLKPDRLDAILSNIELARTRIYGRR